MHGSDITKLGLRHSHRVPYVAARLLLAAVAVVLVVGVLVVLEGR
jgi:hypothetical protein